MEGSKPNWSEDEQCSVKYCMCVLRTTKQNGGGELLNNTGLLGVESSLRGAIIFPVPQILGIKHQLH